MGVLDIANSSVELGIGMHEVGKSWNGVCVSHEVTMEDHYEFHLVGDEGCMKTPTVHPMGEASDILPPYSVGTGEEPEGPDPYLGTRDASYTCGNAERQACKMDDVCREVSGEMLSEEDAFAPEGDRVYHTWSLGENNMQSLFVDLHCDDYMEALDMAMSNLPVKGSRPFLDEWKVRETFKCNKKEFECWSHEQFDSVHAEEEWTEENGSVELTRALTTVENARLEWNSARIKWPVLDGETGLGPAGSEQPQAEERPSLEQHSFWQLSRLGLAFTWPLVVGGVAIIVLLALFNG